MANFINYIKMNFLPTDKVAYIDANKNINASSTTVSELSNVKLIKTNGEGLTFLSDDGTYKTPGNIDISDIISEALLANDMKKYPVGKLEFNTSGVNPNSYLGFGTWVLWGEGRVPVCVAQSGIFAGAETEVGSETVTLTESQMPKHTHTQAAHTHTFTGAALASHSHTFSGSSHTHTYAHTHTVPAHSHGLNSHKHSFSATTSSNGVHSHNIRTKVFWSFDQGDTTGCLGRSTNTGQEEIKWGGTDGFGALDAGAHTHTISGTSGAASGNTANSSVLTTSTSGGNTNSVTAGGTISGISAGTPTGTNSSTTPTINSTRRRTKSFKCSTFYYLLYMEKNCLIKIFLKQEANIEYE